MLHGPAGVDGGRPPDLARVAEDNLLLAEVAFLTSLACYKNLLDSANAQAHTAEQLRKYAETDTKA